MRAIDLEEVAAESIKELGKVLKDESVVTPKTKIAMQTLGAYTRLRATDNHDIALKYKICKDFADKNMKELKELVAFNIPEIRTDTKLIAETIKKDLKKVTKEEIRV